MKQKFTEVLFFFYYQLFLKIFRPRISQQFVNPFSDNAFYLKNANLFYKDIVMFTVVKCPLNKVIPVSNHDVLMVYCAHDRQLWFLPAIFGTTSHLMSEFKVFRNHLVFDYKMNSHINNIQKMSNS